jgi:O-acetyl-ADP-ribose deacetylase (regulator of RNase III)
VALVNSANEGLSGTQFTPSECSRFLSPGTTIIYPPQSVDGLVTELGGSSLAAACERVPHVPTGGAALTPAFGELLNSFSYIVHACAPFHPGEASGPGERARWRHLMRTCYHAAFDVAHVQGLGVLAVPLLGAGARGAPVKQAAAVAAAAAVHWRPKGLGEQDDAATGPSSRVRELRFAAQHPETARILAEAFDAALDGTGVVGPADGGSRRGGDINHHS